MFDGPLCLSRQLVRTPAVEEFEPGDHGGEGMMWYDELPHQSDGVRQVYGQYWARGAFHRPDGRWGERSL